MGRVHFGYHSQRHAISEYECEQSSSGGLWGETSSLLAIHEEGVNGRAGLWRGTRLFAMEGTTWENVRKPRRFCVRCHLFAFSRPRTLSCLLLGRKKATISKEWGQCERVRVPQRPCEQKRHPRENNNSFWIFCSLERGPGFESWALRFVSHVISHK